MKTRKFNVEVPERLAAEIEARLARGEFKTEAELFEAALRYYFERNTAEAWAEYVKEEIQAGFHEPA
ncbi:MAG: hypothetical protein JRJ87_26275 [Deltaproteobacteria bacterium]|nr:hypothetical protein [Deltaproteobacteria bacterium]